MALITKAEYARRLGTSRQHVNGLIKAGKLTPTEEGLIDQEKADAELASRIRSPYTSPKTGGRPREDGMPVKVSEKAQIVVPVGYEQQSSISGMDFAKLKTERERVALERDVLALGEKKGQLLDATEVKDAAFKLGMALRDNFLRIPQRVSSQLAAISDEHEVRQIIDDEIRKAMAVIQDE